MAARLERESPESALLGIWRVMADTAEQDFVLCAIRQGISVPNIAAQLGRSASEIAAILNEFDGCEPSCAADRC